MSLGLNHVENEKLLEFQKLANETGLRSDIEYLYRYLVGHSCDVNSALKALKNYESFVNRRREGWLKFKKPHVCRFFRSQIVDILDINDGTNRKIVWVKLEKWDPSMFSPDEILQASGLLCELLYQMVTDITAIDVIMDLENFSLRQLYALSTKFAKRMVFFMSECLPMNLQSVYVVRQPKIFYLLYALFKPFLGDKIKRMLHVSGYDYTSLVNCVGSDSLPFEFGGTALVPSPNRWTQLLEKKKSINDLKRAGYEIL